MTFDLLCFINYSCTTGLDAVVKRNPPTRKKTLKVELGQSRKKCCLAERQAFLLEQRQREFRLQLGLSQFRRLEEFVWQRDRHRGTRSDSIPSRAIPHRLVVDSYRLVLAVRSLTLVRNS